MKNRTAKLIKRLAAAAMAVVLSVGFLPAAHAQAATEYKPTVEKVYRYNDELEKYQIEKNVSRRYDSKGRMTKKVYDYPEYKQKNITNYTYEKNKITGKRYFKENGKSKYTGKEVYTFDGNTILKKVEYSGDTVESKTVYKTDSAGRIVKAVKYNYFRGEKQKSLTIKITYNSKGNMTQLKCIAPDGTVVQTQKFTYNSKGYLQKEVVYEGGTKFLTVNYDKYTHGKPQRAVTNCIIAVKEKFLTTYEKEPKTVYDKINLWYEDNLAENRYFIPG